MSKQFEGEVTVHFAKPANIRPLPDTSTCDTDKSIGRIVPVYDNPMKPYKYEASIKKAAVMVVVLSIMVVLLMMWLLRKMTR